MTRTNDYEQSTYQLIPEQDIRRFDVLPGITSEAIEHDGNQFRLELVQQSLDNMANDGDYDIERLARKICVAIKNKGGRVLDFGGLRDFGGPSPTRTWVELSKERSVCHMVAFLHKKIATASSPTWLQRVVTSIADGPSSLEVEAWGTYCPEVTTSPPVFYEPYWVPPVDCGSCEWRGNSEGELIVHLREKDHRPHHCPWCGRGFPSSDLWHQHRCEVGPPPPVVAAPFVAQTKKKKKKKKKVVVRKAMTDVDLLSPSPVWNDQTRQLDWLCLPPQNWDEASSVSTPVDLLFTGGTTTDLPVPTVSPLADLRSHHNSTLIGV
jgi:hypothetical protein